MFELNNQEIINRTLQSHVLEIEPLYWVLEDSLYKGDRDRAKAAFHLLLYTAKYRPDLIASGLRPKQRDRMQEICEEMNGQPSKKKILPIAIKFASNPKQLPFTKEQELQTFLHYNSMILDAAFHDKVFIRGTEVSTDSGFKCDLVAEGNKIFYPIELKIGQADHRVVSQIEKYLDYFYRTLRYSLYKELQGVVISNGFCSWSINELRRRGIWIFDIFPDNDKIKLVRIE